MQVSQYLPAFGDIPRSPGPDERPLIIVSLSVRSMKCVTRWVRGIRSEVGIAWRLARREDLKVENDYVLDMCSNHFDDISDRLSWCSRKLECSVHPFQLAVV